MGHPSEGASWIGRETTSCFAETSRPPPTACASWPPSSLEETVLTLAEALLRPHAPQIPAPREASREASRDGSRDGSGEGSRI